MSLPPPLYLGSERRKLKSVFIGFCLQRNRHRPGFWLCVSEAWSKSEKSRLSVSFHITLIVKSGVCDARARRQQPDVRGI